MENDTRTPEQLRHHYEVERELAQRLLQSSREERTQLFKTLYGELFRRVPDHSRVHRRETPESIRKAVASRMSLLQDSLPGVTRFLEFAPGDCTLAFEACRQVETVYGVDISDQTSQMANIPSNFKLILYDGYHLDLPDNSMDLVFSYQFLEHLHPDDIEGHFRLVHRILRPGGRYVIATPHRLSGPHDISAYFSDTPQGFHFKEWTYGDLGRMAAKTGYARWFTYRFGKLRRSRLVNGVTLAAESLLDLLPRKLEKKIAQRLFQGVCVLVEK